MALNLREHAATAGLRKTVQGNFGMPVDIVFASGNEQLSIQAQVLYDTEEIDPESGDLISVRREWVTLIKADLDEEINQGDTAYFKIPKSPDDQTTKIERMLDNSQQIVDGASLGFIRIPLTQVEQA